METQNPPKYLDIFEKLGLNKNEAQIYELLLETGPQSMKPILFHTKLKRGNAYYHLDNLKAKGLVETQEQRGRTTFEAKHPQNLELLLAKQKAALTAAEEELNKSLPALQSMFQLSAIKPEIRFYEGLEGALKVLDDSLTAQTPIYSYIDNEAVNKLYPDINKEYVAKRNRLAVKKKMITIDSPFIHEHAKEFNKSTTEIRVIKSPTAFATVMQIYDNKISYLTLLNNKIVSIVIDHPQIAKMHKTLFEAQWETAMPLSAPSHSAAKPAAALA